MFIYGEKRKEIKPIDRSDLVYLSQQLRKFIIYYEKYIYKNKEDDEIISKLKKYSDLLTMERYDLLLNDTSIIFDDLSDS